jgi:alpha-1,6-mannosyltransferase
VTDRHFLGLLGCGVVLLTLTASGLYAQRIDNLDPFVAIALAQGGVYLLALGLIWRGPASRGGLAVILGVAVAMRLTIMVAPPFLSSDVYRYVWDGRVLAAGVNPYRYIPTDPHLAPLRDNEIFPLINRSNYAPTIYPPAAEAIFFAVTRVSATVTAMKAAMIVFEAIAVLLLLRLLVAAGLPQTRIIVYAWHPLPIWEFAGSGHIDAAIIAFVALTLWSRRFFAGRGLAGEASGLALALGVLVKFYPAVLFPALWRREWRMSAAFAAALALAYLPFLGVGWGVFGFLPGYLAEEGFTAGGAGFYLWSATKAVLPVGGVPDIAYLAAAACLLAGLGLYLGLRREDTGSAFFGAGVLAAAFTLLLSPHYPWYFAWLIVFACLVPSVSLLWLTLASFVLYLVPVGSQLVWNRHRFFVESVLYVPFLVLAAIDLWRRRNPRAAVEQLRHGDNRG